MLRGVRLAGVNFEYQELQGNSSLAKFIVLSGKAKDGSAQGVVPLWYCTIWPGKAPRSSGTSRLVSPSPSLTLVHTFASLVGLSDSFGFLRPSPYIHSFPEANEPRLTIMWRKGTCSCRSPIPVEKEIFTWPHSLVFLSYHCHFST